MLDQEISEDWEPEVQAQWRSNQSNVRMEILAEHGMIGGEDKIANYRALGVAPWSIVYEHNEALSQVRSAFAHGDFYPALVGACALGERIFNHLILDLRCDYADHPKTTKRARSKNTFTDWGAAIDVLHGWGVLNDEVREGYLALEVFRHDSVHYSSVTDVVNRERALDAIRMIQQIVQSIFAPMGGPPTFIPGTSGASFISLAAEATPLIRRVFLPRSALVSPNHGMRPVRAPRGELRWQVVDETDYDDNVLTDAEFAAALAYV